VRRRLSVAGLVWLAVATFGVLVMTVGLALLVWLFMLLYPWGRAAHAQEAMVAIPRACHRLADDYGVPRVVTAQEADRLVAALRDYKGSDLTVMTCRAAAEAQQSARRSAQR
jgi:hypothetical protein